MWYSLGALSMLLVMSFILPDGKLYLANHDLTVTLDLVAWGGLFLWALVSYYFYDWQAARERLFTYSPHASKLFKLLQRRDNQDLWEQLPEDTQKALHRAFRDQQRR